MLRGTFIKAHYRTLLKRTIILSHSLFIIGTRDTPTTTYHRLRVLSFMLRAQKNLKGLSIVFYRLPSIHVTLQRRRTIDYRPVWGSLRLTPIIQKRWPRVTKQIRVGKTSCKFLCAFEVKVYNK